MTFYSQHGEDKWILENLPLPAKGVFVEVGVGHSSHNSNSKVFEDLGWTGILVEPDPRTQPEIRANRKSRLFPYAVGERDGTVVFIQENEPTVSGILRTNGNKITVELRKLDTILAEAGIGLIDVLSIDTEGSELQVLNGLDFGKHQPSIVIVEWSTIGLPEHPDAIIRFMLTKGYEVAWATCGNLLFHRSDVGCSTYRERHRDGDSY
jgi:FkbM family methyltransferase